MPSETDPLLPRGNTAPEITGYGFSNPYKSRSLIEDDYPEDIEDKNEQHERPKSSDSSPLRIFLVIFIIVVGLAMLASWLMPGAFDAPWKMVPKDDALTVKARVDKILAETPLIGLQTSLSSAR